MKALFIFAFSNSFEQVQYEKAISAPDLKCIPKACGTSVTESLDGSACGKVCFQIYRNLISWNLFICSLNLSCALNVLYHFWWLTFVWPILTHRSLCMIAKLSGRLTQTEDRVSYAQKCKCPILCCDLITRSEKNVRWSTFEFVWIDGRKTKMPTDRIKIHSHQI